MNWETIIVGFGGVVVGAFLQYYLNQKHTRYNLLTNEQFNIYQKVWEDLVSLKESMQILWDNPELSSLFNFSQKIKKLLREVERKKLILSQSDYRQLREILVSISEFEIGKRKLISVQSNSDISPDEINEIIERNMHYKQKYELLLNKIYKDIRKKLKVNN